MSIRARLATVTANFNWGLISGKHFGFELNVDDPLTQLQCEYKFHYSLDSNKRCFHVLVYNKSGVYVPAMQGFVNQLKGLNVGSGFLKSALFCLAILLFLWISTTCRNRESVPNDDSIIGQICEYKSTVFFTMALGILVVMMIGNIIGKLGNIKNKAKLAKK